LRRYSHMTVAVIGHIYNRDIDSVTEAKTMDDNQITLDQYSKSTILITREHF
jgi:hypothetical protein